MNKELEKLISNMTIFSALDDEVIKELLNEFELITYNLGSTIVREGDEGKAFYIIYSGQAKVIDTDSEGESITLALLNKGDFFGERSLLTGECISKTIKADTDSVVAKLSEEKFLTLIEKSGDFKSYLNAYLFHRAIYNFLRKFSIFGELNPKEVATWFKSLNYEKVRHNNEFVFKEGDRADKFYIIIDGKADVIKNIEGKDKTISTLEEGQFFGELAIINDQPRLAGIRANGDLKLVSFSKDDFKAMIKKSPTLEEKINNVIEMYQIQKETSNEFSSSKSERVDIYNSPAMEDRKIQKECKFVEYQPKRGFFSLFKKRFPLIKQYDESDCGAACLTMVAKYYGKHLSLTKVKDLANVSQSGATMLSISYASEELGFNTKALHLNYDELLKIKLPAILHFDTSHYIVLYEADKRGVIIADPAVGIRKVLKDEFIKEWSGYTLLLEATQKLESVEEVKISFLKFLNTLLPHKKLVFEVFLISLLISLFGLAAPLFTRLIIDNIVVHQNTGLLNSVVIAMIIVSVFMGLAIALRTYLMTYLGNKVQIVMLGQFYKHILSLPMKFFATRKVGDIMARFNESNRIQAMMTSNSLSLFVDTIMIVVYVSVMFAFNADLTLMILGFILVASLITLSLTGVLRNLSRQSFAKSAEADSYLVESLSGINTIKANASEITSRWKWEDLFVDALKLKSQTAMTNSLSQAVGAMLRTLAIMILLWYGTVLVMRGEMSMGQIMAFYLLVMMSMAPITKLLSMWNEIQETLMSVERLNDIYDVKAEEVLDEDTMQHLPAIKGHVKFEKVSFAYSRASSYILKNISFEASAGQKIAIVGRSGSGKSTLINLLLRFFPATNGNILIDGYNVKQMSIKSLREQIGIVLQDTHLFNGTIRENIALAKPDASFAEVVEVATLAAAHEFIKDLPLGYNTVVGERGMGLSGGQKQRIAIARALIGNPKILIFDEATSALDNESEKAIQNNLGAITENRTTFIIAHRLSTVKSADLILVLDKGAIVEQGTHAGLIKKRGLYFYLQSQSLSLS